MKIKLIITGVTGMVGEGVLHESLQHPDVEKILVINRRPCGIAHPKLQEIIHKDFFNLDSIESQLKGYDACFFCLGVSSVGMKEDEYSKFTYMLTINVAKVLLRQNPSMTFCYISGSGTDSSEKRKIMWARVKGKTENDLMKMPFKKVFAFRPGFMKPTKGLKNTLTAYKLLGWLYPVLHAILPKYASTLKEVGLSMINVAIKGYPKQILEVPDIVKAARQ